MMSQCAGASAGLPLSEGTMRGRPGAGMIGISTKPIPKGGRMKSNHLSLAIAVAIAAASQPAFAQEQATTTTLDSTAAAQSTTKAKPGEQTLDTITVTARRRTEAVKDVPVAVSAFSEESLKDLQAKDISGLQGAVPNMNIVQGRGSSNSVNVFIRGIGQPDALQTFDPGVGMYVDDVYYSRINGALFSLFDVAQVEVLRGPQGTLYGKNSTGGAIKISTKDPFMDTTRSVEATVGDHGRREARFYVGGKITDTFAASIAGGFLKNDGYVTDPSTGLHYNGDETQAIRAKLAFKPNDKFNAVLSLDYTHQDAPLTLGQPTAPLIATSLYPAGPVLLQPAPTGKYDYKTGTSFAPDKGQKMTHQGGALNMTWNLSPEWALKSITSRRQLDTASYIDIDASKFQLGDVFVGMHQKQWSQELQLQYSGRNVHAIVGAYYLNEKVPSHQEAYADDLIYFLGKPVNFLRTIDDNLTNTSKAVFVDVDWQFVPSWTLGAGVRYTKDHKDYTRTTSAFFGAPLGAYSADPQAVIAPGVANKSWGALTPSVSLKKAFSDDVTAYASANRGFKSGGFNGRANSQAESDNPVFNPEFVWTYELGLKMQSEDHRYSANIAAFHSDYKDFQARVSEVLESGGIPSFNFPVLNAASMKMDGVELEGLARVGEATTLSAQLGWMNARYAKFADLRLDPSRPDYDPHIHDHVPFSPKVTARVAAQHAFDLGDHGTLSVGGDASYRSETWLSVDNRPNLSQGSYTLFGLFGTWDSPDYTWQLRAGVRNLTDVTYKTEGQEFSSVGNIQTAYFGWPRNYYVSLRYNF